MKWALLRAGGGWCWRCAGCAGCCAWESIICFADSVGGSGECLRFCAETAFGVPWNRGSANVGGEGSMSLPSLFAGEDGVYWSHCYPVQHPSSCFESAIMLLFTARVSANHRILGSSHCALYLLLSRTFATRAASLITSGVRRTIRVFFLLLLLRTVTDSVIATTFPTPLGHAILITCTNDSYLLPPGISMA